MMQEIETHNKPEARSVCLGCAVRHSGLCGTLASNELASLRGISRHRRIRSGQRIISEMESPNWVGIIVSGSVKITKVLPDGRQQIVALLFPSDFVGQPLESRCTYYAEATSDVALCTFPAVKFEELMQQQPRIKSPMFRYMLERLEAAQDWMVLLGRKSAQERVASLFLMIVKRSREAGGVEAGGSKVVDLELPLSRADIADFLGLTIETVSRQLRLLKCAGVIKLDGRKLLTVLDMSKLEAASSVLHIG